MHVQRGLNLWGGGNALLILRYLALEVGRPEHESSTTTYDSPVAATELVVSSLLELDLESTMIRPLRCGRDTYGDTCRWRGHKDVCEKAAILASEPD
jgi:hypothetical protein